MIKLHHLRFSRSTRIIWLLEELGIDYEIEMHDRHPETGRSQDDLAAIHPLSKAPTVEIDGHVMVESSAIIEYIVEKYGDGKLLPPSSDDRAPYLEWLHFAEGTMGMSVILTLLAPRFGGLGDILGGFIGGEVNKLLDYCDTHMQGREFLVADTFTGADINLEYLLELSNVAGLLNGRPAAKAYLDRLMARPAYKKAIEIGGPLVNLPG
jgi:glutathione S-transferase